MKEFFKYFSVAVIAVASLSACQKEKLSETSVIKVYSAPQNDFDKWLMTNYVNPYNIDFKYRFEMNESDLNYYTVPAGYDESIVMAHLVKYLCIDTYDEVAGVDFTRSYFPKMFFLIGEWEYRNNGTYILGTAEGGKKILLSGINYLYDVLGMGADALNYYYIKTIHHEFTHILNQTRDYPAGFREVTGTTYVADSWSASPYNVGYLQRGYISAYAQHSSGEDFAELLSIYITNDPEWWAAQLATAGSDGSNGDELILTKLDFVRSYMKDTFDIDIDLLRSVILRRQDEVLSGKIDLEDLTI